MSENVIPLWKQELLKRRERKLSKEDNTTSFVDKRTSKSGLVLTNVQTKGKNVSERFRKNSTEHHEKQGLSRKISDSAVDGYATSQCEDNHLTTANNTSRIAQLPHELSSKGRATLHTSRPDHVANHSENERNRLNTPRISRIDGECPESQKNIHSLHLDEKEREKLRQFLSLEQGVVDDEHIRPKDLKKLWKRHESKEQLSPEGINVDRLLPKKSDLVNHVSKMHPKNKPKDVEMVENAHGDHLPPSAPRANVPKRYVSPFARVPDARSPAPPKSPPREQPKRNSLSTGVEHPKMVQRSSETNKGVTRKLKNEQQRQNADGESHVADDNKVENMHIPSVKSLLGLFGGKASDSSKCQNILNQETKMDKVLRQKSSGSPTSPQRPSRLVRHHSEPNLYVSNSDTNVSKLDKAQADDQVGMTSHHVAYGIKERMTLLRRASSSLADDEHAQSDDSDGTSHVAVSKTALKETVAKETTTSNNPDPFTVDPSPKFTNKGNEILSTGIVETEVDQKLSKTNTGDLIVNREYKPSTVKNTEKNSVKSNDKLSQVVHVNNDRNSDTLDRIDSSYGTEINQSCDIENEHQQQSFDKLLSVFGPRVGKKSVHTINNIKPPKSSDGILHKQSHYVVEVAQSKKSLGDQEMSTTQSNRITQNQQAYPEFIKKETESQETESDGKQSKNSLVIVDTSEVSKNKDAVLPKEKQNLLQDVVLKPVGTKQPFEIITFEPDRQDENAQINHVSDLNNSAALLTNGSVEQKDMNQASKTPSKENSNSIPVTSIDEIPVSSIIDDVPTVNNVQVINESKHVDVVDTSVSIVKVDNSIFYNGALTTQKVKEDAKTKQGDIPVSSIDAVDPEEDDVGSLLAPEIIHDISPDSVKSILTTQKAEKRGNVSFFQHVYIHDYQSESAATSDWDFKNCEAIGSYMPHAVRQYEELPEHSSAVPVSKIDQPEPIEPENVEPAIVYNENESMGFTESNDSMAGAMLF